MLMLLLSWRGCLIGRAPVCLPQVRELRMRDMRSLSGSSAHIQRLITADTRRLGTALREVRVCSEGRSTDLRAEMQHSSAHSG